MKEKILIIGATGSIGRKVRDTLLERTDWELVLFSRQAGRIAVDDSRETAISGNVYNEAELVDAMEDVTAVVVALTGDLGAMAKAIVGAMKKVGLERIIFISSMGIYNEIPARIGSNGNLEHNPVLQTYREGADVVEASGLQYTVIRPGWFDNGTTEFTISRKGQPFEGHDVSRQAIADFILNLLEDGTVYINERVGIHRPD
ncbi:MAG: NAD(P)H-binding protein [Veillonella sp.]|uniref:NAD(P)H-binding protein n=1 Tax=Veillonella sp. TaxID=1926307 RepID=UPI0025EBC38B|nr:NAD(P)H-binding protein [Veillonella sp.]MBS4914316.1 NAD(P)H-binding protein [Veillonella sp.]